MLSKLAIVSARSAPIANPDPPADGVAGVSAAGTLAPAGDGVAGTADEVALKA